jgi:hypothetical protein
VFTATTTTAATTAAATTTDGTGAPWPLGRVFPDVRTAARSYGYANAHVAAALSRLLPWLARSVHCCLHAGIPRLPRSGGLGDRFAGLINRTRRGGRVVVYATTGCFAHPKTRAFWLGGVSEDGQLSEDRRAQGQ